MCLVTSSINPKIAKKDITCYKVVRSFKWFPVIWKSAWGFSKKNYLFNKKITEKVPFDVRYSDSFESGCAIHGGGFHSFNNKDIDDYKQKLDSCFKLSPFWKFEICRCTIPVGTEYYNGICNDIVSKSIIVHKP